MATATDNAAERSYEPTHLRLREARRRGKVARSADLAAAAVLLGGAAGLGLLGGRLLGKTVAMTRALLDGRSAPLVGPSELAGIAADAVTPLLTALAPLAAALVLLAVAVNVGQVGLLATGAPLRPVLARIGLTAGWRRLISARTGVRAGMIIGKLAAIGVVAWITVADALPRVAAMGRLAPRALVSETGALAWTLAMRVALVLGVLGLADYLFQRRQLRRELRMTRREWLDDLRRTEGHPLARRRHRKDSAGTPSEAMTEVTHV
ncbi:MAG: EscU/YscU/HrcU family type III secretion system export apparatus switch protein [Phycisphaerae bacterium]|nr:EscU/YscU/HrcU family type III secretion system export apparatus switch protein [Phycisphaerae bacterium]